MDIRLITNSAFEPDFMDIVRAFAPYVTVAEDGIQVNINIDGGNIEITADDYKNIKSVDITDLSEIKCKSEVKRLAKIMLYDYLSNKTGVSLPYGSLTGIRPTKLYHDIEMSGEDAYEYFTEYLRVSKPSADLLKEICSNQAGIYNRSEDEVDLFVNIPICITRCSYCSFISAEYGRIKHWIAPYVAQLVREIAHARQIVKDKQYKVRSIYVGGGTPTSLNEDDFDKVIGALEGIECMEFTVEAGRPDTITREKLAIMAKYGVNRISINPQSFNDKTLKLIGRGHDSSQIYEVYKMAREFDFDINMDLIAMLPDEIFEDFKYSVDEAIRLAPENITVHTLAIKKGSNLKLAEYDNKAEELPFKMIEYSREAIEKAGYKPYYMYKQKYMSGNLDNTGYAKPNKACVYNIDIMEETHSIIACGAGGISKRVFHSEGRLERLANPKGIDVYMDREDKILADKVEFYK